MTTTATTTAIAPLKPRRGLMIFFGILLIVLFAVMVALYFATVYPNRDKPRSVEIDSAMGWMSGGVNS